MIAAAIIAAEVGFWVLLAGGLAARYLLGQPRLGAALLIAVPAVDVALLAVTAADLARGASADWTHGLAAIYLGVSVVFGPSVIRAADRRAARRLGRPAPAPARPSSAERLAAQWRLWGRAVLAAGLAAAILGGLVAVGGPADTRALWSGGGWFAQLALVAGAWLVLGPAWTAAAQRLTQPMRREGTR
ncbi:MAG TPA: hypothetical protein VM844_09490 [Miltoncostaeaceae bacterium]|nr:hypothetical protein [Miltoncostaeaceae bacterium]